MRDGVDSRLGTKPAKPKPRALKPPARPLAPGRGAFGPSQSNGSIASAALLTVLTALATSGGGEGPGGTETVRARR
ncbi:hypothetical protein [Streptomyces sp. NPDC005262]|uniref:hypothetical protein n=1 Tax=Streptomyces sp. NPDC005262 TaxID=3364710 RepID=UPI00368F5A9E